MCVHLSNIQSKWFKSKPGYIWIYDIWDDSNVTFGLFMACLFPPLRRRHFILSKHRPRPFINHDFSRLLQEMSEATGRLKTHIFQKEIESLRVGPSDLNPCRIAGTYKKFLIFTIKLEGSEECHQENCRIAPCPHRKG